jgi:hypothetical protein
MDLTRAGLKDAHGDSSSQLLRDTAFQEHPLLEEATPRACPTGTTIERTLEGASDLVGVLKGHSFSVPETNLHTGWQASQAAEKPLSLSLSAEGVRARL